MKYEIQILVSINKVLNFVNRNFVEVHFLYWYINIYIRASILPFGPPQYLLSGPLQQRFSGPGVFIIKNCIDIYTHTCLCCCFVYKTEIVRMMLWQSSLELKPLNESYWSLWVEASWPEGTTKDQGMWPLQPSRGEVLCSQPGLPAFRWEWEAGVRLTEEQSKGHGEALKEMRQWAVKGTPISRLELGEYWKGVFGEASVGLAEFWRLYPAPARSTSRCWQFILRLRTMEPLTVHLHLVWLI